MKFLKIQTMLILSIISSVVFAKTEVKVNTQYVNVIVRKHQKNNTHDIVVDNSYTMCISPSQYPCVIELNKEEEKVGFVFHKNSNLIDVNYIQNRHLIENNKTYIDKVSINKVYIFDSLSQNYTFTIPEIETTKNLNSSNETQIELKLSVVK
jgi:hypothetical protein